MIPDARARVIVIAIVTVFTVGIHYGWIIEPLFGHVTWLHAVHARFCYIPIMIAAAWFGLRGGVYTATAITILVLPLVFRSAGDTQAFTREIAEIVFYYTFAVLIGLLVDREYETRQAQQEAQQQVERSQKLSLVGQVAAGVAHEIKNPLASIKGAADILADDDTSSEEREEFKVILQNEVRRIDSTVAEFLEFARPRETRRERMNLTDTIRQSVRQMESEAARQGITVESVLEDDVMIDGDSEKLHQMTLNLLLNAVQASESGGLIRVTVGDDDTAAVVTVVDNGAGIRTDDMERIFEPFFTTRTSGTGLGLAVVRAIVDAHDGHVDVESTRGKGTTIEIRLPLVEAT